MTRCLAILLCACTPAAASQSVHVYDGDTLSVDGTRWRLWGVDAPELDQACTDDNGLTGCGPRARDNLAALVAGKPVSCTAVGRSYDRIVGRCFAGGVDLSAAQVEAGWAMDYVTYSHGAYEPQQTAAMTERRGLWRMHFVPPWEWRRLNRRK